MPTATSNNTIITEGDETIVVDGNQYFPPTRVKMQYMAVLRNGGRMYDRRDAQMSPPRS